MWSSSCESCSPDRALEHAERRQLADERVDDDFEDVRKHVLVGVRLGADFSRVRARSFVKRRRVAFLGVRHQARENVEQLFHARAGAP